MEYKGYRALVKWDTDHKKYFGTVIGVKEVITFMAPPHSMEEEFHRAVDEYLVLCADMKEKPDREYKGQFNVRIGSELHRELAVRAKHKSMSQNSLLIEILTNYIEENSHE